MTEARKNGTRSKMQMCPRTTTPSAVVTEIPGGRSVVPLRRAHTSSMDCSMFCSKKRSLSSSCAVAIWRRLCSAVAAVAVGRRRPGDVELCEGAPGIEDGTASSFSRRRTSPCDSHFLFRLSFLSWRSFKKSSSTKWAEQSREFAVTLKSSPLESHLIHCCSTCGFFNGNR